MKFANKKRAASTVLAGAMALSMATPAFAAAEKNTTITGTYQEIALAVTVPTTGKAIINPYGLPVSLDEETSISGEQITTGAPLVISNQSKVALAVKANIKGEIVGTGGAFKSAAAEVSTEKEKNLLVNFEAFKAPGVLDDTDTAELNAQFAELKSTNAALKAVVTADEAGVDATGTLVLREGDAEGATQDGGAAFFRLSGTVNRAADWEKTDGFKTTVAFTFEPSEYAGSVTLVADGGATEVEEGSTLTVSVDLPSGVKLPTKNPVITWKSSKTDFVTVAADASSTATKLVAKVSGVSASSTSSKISVEFVGTDGITYKSNELTIKCVDANP